MPDAMIIGQLAGFNPRTLRYHESIRLLTPSAHIQAGYHI